MGTSIRDLSSSVNKTNSLGKPTNRWLNTYTNKMLLGDGTDNNDVLLVADRGKINNPAIRYNSTNNQWEFSNTGENYITFDTNELIKLTDTDLLLSDVKGKIINNYGQTEDCTLNLPKAVAGLTFIVVLGTTINKYYRLKANTDDKIYLNGTPGIINQYVGVASATEGSAITFSTFKTGESKWNWLAVTVSGTWVSEPASGWNWIKFSMLPIGYGTTGEEVYHSEINKIAVMNEPWTGEDPPGLAQSFPTSLSLPSLGTVYASSYMDNEYGSYPPEGPFYADNSHSMWSSEVKDTRNEEWLAFKFNQPTTASHLYLSTTAKGIMDSFIPPGGGDIMVSSDSTNGIDGTWQTLRTGILDTLSSSTPGDNPWDLQFFAGGLPRTVFLIIPLLSSTAPVTVYEG